MLLHFLVRVLLLHAGVDTVVDEAGAVAIALIDMSVNCIVADVHLAIFEPIVDVLVLLLDDTRELLGPHELVGLLGPVLLSVADGARILLVVQRVAEIVGFTRVPNILVFCSWLLFGW